MLGRNFCRAQSFKKGLIRIWYGIDALRKAAIDGECDVPGSILL